MFKSAPYAESTVTFFEILFAVPLLVVLVKIVFLLQLVVAVSKCTAVAVDALVVGRVVVTELGLVGVLRKRNF